METASISTSAIRGPVEIVKECERCTSAIIRQQPLETHIPARHANYRKCEFYFSDITLYKKDWPLKI